MDEFSTPGICSTYVVPSKARPGSGHNIPVFGQDHSNSGQNLGHNIPVVNRQRTTGPAANQTQAHNMIYQRSPSRGARGYEGIQGKGGGSFLAEDGATGFTRPPSGKATPAWGKRDLGYVTGSFPLVQAWNGKAPPPYVEREETKRSKTPRNARSGSLHDGLMTVHDLESLAPEGGPLEKQGVYGEGGDRFNFPGIRSPPPKYCP